MTGGERPERLELRLEEELTEDGVLDLFVTPEYLLTDPAPEKPKTLRVRWQENGHPDASSFSEGTHVVLPRSAVPVAKP